MVSKHHLTILAAADDGLPVLPMESMPHIPLFAQQPIFNPYSYDLKGTLCQATQSQGHNSQTTPMQGTNSRMPEWLDSNSQSHHLMCVNELQAQYIPQTSMYSQGYNHIYGQRVQQSVPCPTANDIWQIPLPLDGKSSLTLQLVILPRALVV